MSDLKPGFYKATVRGVPDQIVMVTGSGMGYTPDPVCHQGVNYPAHPVYVLADARPLIVLDLDDPRRVLADLHAAIEASGNGMVSQRLRRLQDAIAAQVPKPRIPEPGLWGVVLDSEGATWVRVGPRVGTLKEWRYAEGLGAAYWDQIDDPTLIRGGV